MKPNLSAKNETGDFDKFTEFMRHLVAVPHSEIKAKLAAEKKAKRTPKPSAFPAPASASKSPSSRT